MPHLHPKVPNQHQHLKSQISNLKSQSQSQVAVTSRSRSCKSQVTVAVTITITVRSTVSMYIQSVRPHAYIPHMGMVVVKAGATAKVNKSRPTQQATYYVQLLCRTLVFTHASHQNSYNRWVNTNVEGLVHADREANPPSCTIHPSMQSCTVRKCSR